MRITIKMAEQIAKAAFAPTQVLIEEKNKELSKMVYEAVKIATPKPVFEVAEKHPDYLPGHTRTFKLMAPGEAVEHTQFKTEESLPAKEGFSSYYQIDKHSLLEIRAKHKEINKMKDRAAADQIELEKAILGLTTVKRAKEALPEIAHLFPENESTALTVNLDNVKSILSNLPK